jgi:hypothetical protein
MPQNAETRLPRSFLRAEQSRYLHVVSYLYMYQFDASQQVMGHHKSNIERK